MKGDPLPPESMALREKIIEAEEERKRLRALAPLPIDEEGERLIDGLVRERQPHKKRKLGDEDSERLKRIERMLVAIYKKLDL